MNNWIKDYLSKNIEFKDSITSKCIEINEVPIHYYQAERKALSIKNNVISRYIIIDYNSMEHLPIFKSVNEFCSFQNEFFSELFYSSRNDLRWNIYLIVIKEDDIEYTDVMAEIENNDDFMRKFFMTKEEFQLFMSNDYIKRTKNIENKNTEILGEWESTLKEIGLEGCLYNKFSTGSVIDYIEKNKKIQLIGRPSINRNEIIIDESIRVKKIDKIRTSLYREHCFGKHIELPLGSINLISGVNGSGKSSICESIEYGFTGSINGKGDNEGEIELECTNIKGNKISFKSNKTNEQIRKIDMAWYGTTSIGRKLTLNNNFSVFNYLSSNSSAKYMQNDININELLKNLIFGEEITDADLKAQRFYEEFNKEYKNISNIIYNLNKEIKELNNNIKDNKNTVNIWNQINEVLESCFIKTDDKYNNPNDEERAKYLINIFDLVVKSVNVLKQNMHILKDYTISDILKLKESLDEKVQKYLSYKDKIECEKKSVVEKNKHLNTLLDNLSSQDYKEEETILHEIERRFNVDDVLLEINNLKLRYNNNAIKKKNLIEIRKMYDDILINNSGNKDVADAEIYELEKSLNIYNNKLIDLEKEINKKRHNLNDASNLYVQLLDIGKNIIVLSENDAYCPLCGHNYHTNTNLMIAIDNAKILYNSVQEDVNSLVDKRNEIKSDIGKLKFELEKLEKAKSLHIRKINLINELNSFMDVNSSMDTEMIYHLLNNEILQTNEDVVKDTENYEFVLNFENSILYVQFKENNSSNSIIKYCNDRIDAIKTRRSEIEKRILALKANISQKQIEIDELNEELLRLENPIDNSSLINLIVENINVILQVFDIERNKYKLYDWCQQYEIGYSILVEINEIIEYNISNYKNKLEIEKKEKDLKLFNIKRERCNDAISAFKSLKSLKEYMEKFISENAETIEKIFKLIHKPKEFSDLKIQDGKISFVRTKTGELTDATKISTGQSVSLTFSILLSLYMSAPNAPRIIILDEPIANMDDMHILNLIDLIRELVLNGTQVFITTANDQIAKFLRRKFSFMEASFVHIIMNRINDNQTKIVEVIYSPEQEGYKEKFKIS